MGGIPFSRFDRSGIPPAGVQEGYAEWSKNYDAMLTDNLDGPVLRAFAKRIAGAGRDVVDLGCGTGRTGKWIAANAPGAAIVGVDICPEMLALAAAKGLYRALLRRDMLETELNGSSFDLVVNVLSACHVSDLRALYAEAARLLRKGGCFALVDYHPHMLLCGKGTVFPAMNGRMVAIENHVHMLRDHVSAAGGAGLEFEGFEESFITEEWLAQGLNKPEFLGHPIGFGFLWKKA